MARGALHSFDAKVCSHLWIVKDTFSPLDGKGCILTFGQPKMHTYLCLPNVPFHVYMVQVHSQISSLKGHPYFWMVKGAFPSLVLKSTFSPLDTFPSLDV